MSLKLFIQIVLLMVIGAFILMFMKCAVMKCPVMGKYMKGLCKPCPTATLPK
jgi:hypothetical protein